MKVNRILMTGAVVLGMAAAIGAMSRHEPDAPSAAAAEPNLFPFVRSFEGTRPDGDAKPGDGETLKVDRELRHLFEYYLAAVGEKPIDAIRAQIERELEQRLPPAPASQAKQLLARYLDYKRALFDVEKSLAPSANPIESARMRLTALQQARKRFFSDSEIEGMFGIDDAYDNDAIARLEISQDKTLDNARKREKLAALDAALPKELQEMRDATLLPAKLAEDAAKMREHGASDDDVYRMRVNAVGAEAANRLAAMDREQVQWKARIATYLEERRKLLDGSPESESNRAALQQLRNGYFSQEEQRRLAAYEQS